MNTPEIGTPFEGGFFAGRMTIDGALYNLIAAPRNFGDIADIVWNESITNIAGATSFFNGMANTVAMLEAGSSLAKWVRDLCIDGRDDWYLPAQDELEILYRAFKPTEEKNSQYGRSGINLTALPHTRPYTPDTPAQTGIEAFKDGGEQEFDNACYWSSTQHSGDSDYAWCQNFYDGYQLNTLKRYELRARAVRRSLVIQ